MESTLHAIEKGGIKIIYKHPDKAKPFVRMGRKATDLINNYKIAGLPGDEKIFWKTGFLQAGFFIAWRSTIEKPNTEEAP